MTLDGTVMSVEVSGNGVFQFGTPKPQFKPKGLVAQPSHAANWDVSSDGKKFTFPLSPSVRAPGPLPRFTVVQHWPSLFKK